VQKVVYVGYSLKMGNLVSGSGLKAGTHGFLLQPRCVGVPDLEFDGVSRVFPRPDSFDDNCFAFG
jgi:hypothetical protein